MIACLEKGIIPHVIQYDGKDGFELEIDYKESEVDASSTKAEELSNTLNAGIIPEAYKEVIEDIEVKVVGRLVKDKLDESEVKSIYGTKEEMVTRAKEAYFVREHERNLVYCTNGEVLRQKKYN